jgi:spoIIIJ-associated protein
MEKQTLERTGRTVEEAIELAILELGVGRDEVEVDVLSKGRAGILGIGAEPARVRVSLITGGSAATGAALRIVNELLETMSADAKASIRSSGSGPEDPTIIDIQGEDAGLIIGRRGETLRALQYVVNIIRGREEENAVPVVVDVEQYRGRREKHLGSMASRMAERAVSTGRPVTLEPMSAADRRIIHMALASDKGVTTESTGDGTQRRVVISPTGERAPRSYSRDGGSTGNRRRRPSGSGGGRGGESRAPRYRDDRD